MALYTIADLHLSLGEDKPMDVFRGWQEYTRRIRENWEALVRPEDTVVIAGDISWAMQLEDSLTDFAFLHRLPGEKILLKGNHDYWWSTRAKLDAFFEREGLSTLHPLFNDAYRVGDLTVCGTRGWLYNAATGEDKKIVAREAGRLRMSLAAGKALGGERVAFLHYPPVYDGAECRELLDVLEEEGIRRCYYGHIHGQYASRKALAEEYHGVELRLVSCDFVDFTPVPVP